MTRPAIKGEGVCKKYLLGERQPYNSLRESLSNSVQKFFGRRVRPPREYIWALNDVSFSVDAGEVLGVIGRNGAGKTTLLKVLSRITHPTRGRLEIEGRVGSLLEVGTGFHPELTGRENILLNGAILGMKRHEIAARFDDIVAFAEVERFIETPVKRYSSGMYLRLAFSVAAHLVPDVLLVDEVLAVGDMEFQKKCIGKMGDIGRAGRTVLLVSHNLSAIQSLCSRVIWIHDGRIRESGEPADVVSHYLQEATSEVAERCWDDPASAPGCDKVRLKRAAIRCESGKPAESLTMVDPVLVEFEYWNLVAGSILNLTIHLINSYGITVFSTSSRTDPNWHGKAFPEGVFRSSCRIPPKLLNQGVYHILLLVVEDQGRVLSQHRELLSFEIHDAPELRGTYFGKRAGVVHPVLDWVTDLLEPGDS